MNNNNETDRLNTRIIDSYLSHINRVGNNITTLITLMSNQERTLHDLIEYLNIYPNIRRNLVELNRISQTQNMNERVYRDIRRNTNTSQYNNVIREDNIENTNNANNANNITRTNLENIIINEANILRNLANNNRPNNNSRMNSHNRDNNNVDINTGNDEININESRNITPIRNTINSLRSQTPYIRRYQSRNQMNRNEIIRRNLLNSESTNNLRIRNPFTDRGLRTGINERNLRDASDVFIRYFPDFYANGQYIGPTISTSTNNEELSEEFLRPIPVHPTSEEITNAIRVVDFESIINPPNAICPITLQPFLNNEMVSEILYCRHIFNTESLNEWFQENVRCPLCRYDIREYNPRTRNTLRIQEINEETIEEDSQEDAQDDSQHDEEDYDETHETNNNDNETIMEEEIVNSDTNSDDTIVNTIPQQVNVLNNHIANSNVNTQNSTGSIIDTIFNGMRVNNRNNEFTSPLFNNLSFITNLDNSVENIESLIRTDNSLNHFLNNINSQISEFNRNNFENSYSQYNSDISNNYSPV